MKTEDAIPVWESVLSAAWASYEFATFAKEAVRHDPEAVRDRFIELSSGEINAGALPEVVRSIGDDQALALDSRCRLADGTEMHLPMMDFRVLSRGGDVSSISTAVQVVGEERGVILRSGRSYHYYGLRPLNHEDWYRFYARCLLLSPITDSRYIAHRLLSGAASLRITPSKLKPFTPKVSALVGSV